MKISIEGSSCRGCGICEVACGDVLEMDGRMPRLKIEDVPRELEACCQKAADICPLGIIKISA